MAPFFFLTKDDVRGCTNVARGHDCMDAGGRATQEQLPRTSVATNLSWRFYRVNWPTWVGVELMIL
jgi:hypothetical protein